MFSRYFSLFAIFAILLIVYGFDRYRIRRAQARNFHSQCARCCASLTWQNYEEVAVGGGELFRTKARICSRCALREKHITRIAIIVLIIAFIATLVLLNL